jgi:polysaccharide pyruvyl transferase WcaK-like protein
VSKITDCAHFDDAWNKAMKYSISKQVIIEQFIKRQGYQIDGDIFVKNGEVVFWGFCDQHNDINCAPYVPVGLSFPSTQHERYRARAKEIVSSILQKLRMTMGAYNIEYIINKTDMCVALIPHVVWEAVDDRKILKEFYEKYKSTNRVFLIDDCPCEELKGYISKCRFFIGARTHSTIAAYSSNVPTLVVGYSVKARGIAKDLFGTWENYVLPAQQIKESNELTKAFMWLEKNEINIKDHLSDILPEYKERINNGINALKAL